MTLSDQNLINNKNNDNKKIPLALVSIRECLECTDQCSNFKVIDSKCGCDCHNNKNSLKLISDDEREYGPTAFAEMCDKHLENGGDPNVI